MKRPSFQFYPSDWLSDTALRSCSIKAQGLWINIMCYMHESPVYGKLLLKQNDKQIPIKGEKLARMIGGVLLDELNEIVSELLESGVMKECPETGAYFSKRMIKDENTRQARALAGSKGGETTQKNNSFAKANIKAKLKQMVEDGEEDGEEDKNIKRVKNKIDEKPSFEDFWNLYDKKVDKKASILKWQNLNQNEKETIILYIPAYVKSTPDKKFRKDPETFFNNRSWENEIISPNPLVVGNQEKPVLAGSIFKNQTVGEKF